jgi:dehydrogenase/reductase SDR family member 7B
MNAAYLRGKTAIVTGASSGIGRSTSIALARAGTNLVLVSRNISKLKTVEQEAQPFDVKTLAISGDISNRLVVKNTVSQAIEKFAGVDILICNAGVYFRHSIIDQTIDDIRNIMEINFFGSLNCIYEILPHFLAKKAGHIIIISSVDGKKGLPLDSAYSSSKFALTGFADVLRQELAKSGIHVCTVFPGRIDTPMISNIKTSGISAKISPEHVAKAIIMSILKRKKEVFVPYMTSKFFVVSNSISSGFGDWGVRFFNLKGKDL